jgi:hypothetical protein
MEITIKIKTDNAAFEGRTWAETARILKVLAAKIDDGEILNEDTRIPLHDVNGNNIGYLTVKE